MTARGASALLFFARLHVVGSAVRGTCGCRSQKVVARAAPPCGPLRGSGPWLARPPARAIESSGVPAANGGARLRAALRGPAACSRGGGNDSMGGRCRRRSSVVGGAPLSGGCGGACRVWGWGLLSWRPPGLGRSAPLHSKPPAPPRPQSPPPCACGRGVGVPLAAASGDGITHLPRIFHINVVNDIERGMTMPSVYLSPSTQEYNPYITGAGSEEYFMNLITDAMEPYLTANTIRFGRNTPEMTAASSIRQGNAGNYDFYLALHSNGSTDGSREGTVRGVIAFYYPGSANGQRAADIFVRNLKTIYPLPEKVYTRSTTALGEVRQPRMPAVLLELGYHDNYADARWVQNNIQAIAANLALSLTEYFGLPFITPLTPWRGTVRTQSGRLNLRDYPSTSGRVVAQLPSGTAVTVYGRTGEWYSVGYQGHLGYAAAAYIQ